MLLLAICVAFPKPASADTNNDSVIQKSTTDIHMYINDQELDGTEAPYVIKDERIYAPVRQVAEHLGAKVTWDKPSQQMEIVTAAGDHIEFKLNSYTMTMNGKWYVIPTCPFAQNNYIYMPLREMAELLQTEVVWDEDKLAVNLKSVPPYKVGKGETMQVISDKLHLVKAQLEELNGIDLRTVLEAGRMLKVVIPDIIRDKAANNEMYLLAKVIDLEAGYEPFEGQIAVGDVILNRVNDPHFPGTVNDVIYAAGQFPPVHEEAFASLVPKNSCILAAEQALGGKNLVQGALYFYNPRTGGSDFFESLDTVADIGNHRFVK